MQKTTTQLLESLGWRYATKRFNPELKISDQDFDVLTDALQLSASSYGLQPYRFVVVRDAETRQALRAASWGQPQITDASHMIVFASKTNLSQDDTAEYMQLISDTRGVPVENLEGFANAINGKINGGSPEELAAWAAKQAYIAIGTLLATAADMRIDACPMEGFNPDQYDEILGLKELGLHAHAVVTLGYRSTEDPLASMKKVRFPKEQLFIQK